MDQTSDGKKRSRVEEQIDALTTGQTTTAAMALDSVEPARTVS